MNQTISLYSRHAVMAFTVFCSPIFGGVLLRQNLLEAGMPEKARIAFFAGLLFTVINFLIITNLKNPLTIYTFLLNLLWGVVFIELFYKKWLGNIEFVRKSIRKPLLVSFLIFLGLMLMVMA